MKLITEDQMNQRLNANGNLCNQVEVEDRGTLSIKKLKIGGTDRKVTRHLSNDERSFVGALANITSIETAAELTGTSIDGVKNWKLGNTVRAHQNGKSHPELKAAIEERLGIVRDLALDKLVESLGLLDKEKIDKSNAVGISTVARNLGDVVTKTLPKERDSSRSPNIVVYAPTVKEVRDFKVVEI